MGTRLALVAVGFALVAACSAFSSDGETGDTPAPDGGSDAAPATDASAGDAASADVVQPDATIYFESFEKGIACGAWTPLGGTAVILEDAGHTGVRSCQVCYGNSGGYIDLSRPGRGPGTYVFTAYARQDTPDAGQPSQFLALYLADGGVLQTSNAATLDGTWKLLEVAAPPTTEDIQTVVVRLLFPYGADGQCFLLDDTTVQYEP